MGKLSVDQYVKVVRHVRRIWKGLKIRPDELVDQLGYKAQACYCKDDDHIYTREPEYYKSEKFLTHVLYHEVAHRVLTKKGIGSLKPRGLDKKLYHAQKTALEEMIVDTVANILFQKQYKHTSYIQNSHEKYLCGWYASGRFCSKKKSTEQTMSYMNKKVCQILRFLEKQHSKK
jgi:antirestriction protein ArdC